jgi:PAS domain S-box-containing protein/diguanylate cyclase (GGDEF)-like protein
MAGKYFLSSIRSRVLLLLGLTFLAVMAAFGYFAYSGREHDLAIATENVRQTAERIADKQSEIIASTRQLLTMLTEAHALREFGPTPQCQQLLSKIVRREPRFATILVAAPNGDVICNATPTPSPINVADRAYFAKALASADLVVEEAIVSRSTGKWSLPFAKAIRGDAGQVHGVLLMQLDLQWVARELSKAELTAGARLGLVDSRGTVLVREPDPEKLVATNIAARPFFKTLLAKGGTGTAEEDGYDKVRRIFGFARFTETTAGPIYLWVGVPKDSVIANAAREFIWTMLVMVIVLILSFAAIWIGSERLFLRPVMAMANTARRLAQGDHQARTGLRYSGNELGQLARTLDEMAVALMSKSELLRLNRTLRLLSECNQALIHATNEKQLLNDICRNIVEVGNYRMAWVGFAEEDEAKTVRPVAHHGYEFGYLDSVEFSWADTELGRGPTGTAIRTGTPQVNVNFATSPSLAPWRGEALKRGYMSSTALPLRDKSRVFGVLSFYAAQADAFNDEEMKLAQELADDISFGLVALRTRAEHERAEQVVRDSEERFRNIFEHAREVIFIVGREREIVSLSPAFEKITGWATAEWSGKTFQALVHPEDLSRAQEIFDGVISANESCAFEMRIAKKSGGYWDGDFSVGPLQHAGGTVLFGIGRDVTERKHAEQKIIRLSRIEAVLSGINSLIVRAESRQQLFDEACRVAVEHGGFGIAWIGLFDPQTMAVVPAAYAGYDAETFFAGPAATANPDSLRGQGEVGRAIRERRASFCNDLAAKPEVGGDRRREAIRRGYRSAIALPLLLEDATAGVLVLYAKDPGYFDDVELKLLNELAGDIAFALDHLAKKEKVDYLAYYDVLTGLPNRALFTDRVNQHLQQAKQTGKIVALLLLDIERFRNISDALGRHMSDALLKVIAQRLSEVDGGQTGIARVGADVFALAGLVNAPPDAAHFVEKQIHDCFSQPFLIENHELRISARLGVAVSPSDGNDADTLYKNAESALLKAKEVKEHYLFYTPEMNARVAETLSIESRLRTAVEKRQFVLYYQPKFDSKTGAIAGMEALIRWDDPATGLVPPARFIPVLEETGLILPVGVWAMKQAVSDRRHWREQGLNPPRVAVNVSAIQLRRKDFVSTVKDAIRGASDGDHGLDLEITESLIMTNIADNIAKLDAIKELGCGVAIDDFGTGYSSLQYLAQLPVDSLKIDRSFIARLPAGGADLRIVSTIIELAHDLELKVVAEGVETEEQARRLRLLYCNEMQGYLFRKPVPAAEIEAILRNPDSIMAGSATT